METKPVFLYKTLVISVIFLFIGIGLQPAFAVTSNFYNNDDGCDICAKKVSKSHFDLISGLLNIFKKYENQLSVLAKQYPQIEEKNQELSSAINIFTEEVDSIYRNGDSFICIIIGMLSSPLGHILNLLAPLPWYPSKFVIATLHSILSVLYVNFNCAE